MNKHIQQRVTGVLSLVAMLVAMVLVVPDARAYTPAAQTMYQMDGTTERCNKGGNYSGCIVYPKAAQLTDGRIVATFERSVGDPVGETLPVYASDDEGATWSKISEVKSPHELEPGNADYDDYVSNWTNPYLYTLPERVGDLSAGTLLLASVVTGDDEYYKEQKAVKGDSWYNSSDGDRKNTAIALFSSTDGGVHWEVQGIVTQGGWQGGSARSAGNIISTQNTYSQVDPVWEPYLMVYDGKLICYYSDERDYSGYDPETGVVRLADDDETGADNKGQILAHRTWSGEEGDAWSDAVLDASGKSFSDGKIGDGRPGMTNVVPTTDGKWLMTYEDWGGDGSTKYKISDNPLEFYKITGQGSNTNNLPVAGSGNLAQGGSPVTVALPDGSILYNASGSGDVWINRTGKSDGEWARYKTTLGGGYSRNLTYLSSGRVLILHTGFSGSQIQYADVDFGNTTGDYFTVTNKSKGLVIGTGGKTQDAAYTGDIPDITMEQPSAGDGDAAKTQQWHMQSKSSSSITFLNRSGGRAIVPWGSARNNVRVAQWVDEGSSKYEWKRIDAGDGYYRLQSVANEALYLTASGDDSVRLNTLSDSDDAQLWSFEKVETSSVSVDKTELRSLVTRALDLEKDKFTPLSWARFAARLDDAQKLLDDPSALQSAVDSARQSLDEALSALVSIAEDRYLDGGRIMVASNGGEITFTEPDEVSAYTSRVVTSAPKAGKVRLNSVHYDPQDASPGTYPFVVTYVLADSSQIHVRYTAVVVANSVQQNVVQNDSGKQTMRHQEMQARSSLADTGSYVSMALLLVIVAVLGGLPLVRLHRRGDA